MLKYVLLIILAILCVRAYQTVDFSTVIPQTMDTIKNSSLINNVNSTREDRKNEARSLGL